MIHEICTFMALCILGFIGSHTLKVELPNNFQRQLILFFNKTCEIVKVINVTLVHLIFYQFQSNI